MWPFYTGLTVIHILKLSTVAYTRNEVLFKEFAFRIVAYAMCGFVEYKKICKQLFSRKITGFRYMSHTYIIRTKLV